MGSFTKKLRKRDKGKMVSFRKGNSFPIPEGAILTDTMAVCHLWGRDLDHREIVVPVPLLYKLFSEAYNPWARTTILHTADGYLFATPGIVKGKHYTLNRRLTDRDSDPVLALYTSVLNDLEVTPFEFDHDDPITGSTISTLTGNFEAEERKIPLLDMGKAPEDLWIQTKSGWQKHTVPSHLAVWLVKEGNLWACGVPEGAKMPPNATFEDWIKTQN